MKQTVRPASCLRLSWFFSFFGQPHFRFHISKSS